MRKTMSNHITSRALDINTAITDLQTLRDFNEDITRLETFIKNRKLSKQNKEDLQEILNLMVIKNKIQKDSVYKVMNLLNKTNFY